MNPSQQSRCGRITEYYRNRIDYLYTPEAKDICNPQNMNIIGKFE